MVLKPGLGLGAGLVSRAQQPPGPLKQLHVGKWLSPFFFTCAVYFLLWIPDDQPSWVGALVKCLPVLSLVVFLRAVDAGGGYSARLQGALLCSAVGDACLVWPKAFLHGERGPVALSLSEPGQGWVWGATPRRGPARGRSQ